MQELVVLSSSSKGNCYLIKFEQEYIMIDCGISAKQIHAHLQELNIDPTEIKSIFISHEHNDHVKGLKTFANKWHTPCYMTENTALFLESKNKLSQNINIIQNNQKILEKFLYNISAISIPHDAVDPIAFTIESQQKKLSIITDLGSYNSNILKSIENSNHLIIESNYEYELLVNSSSRPWKIKQRIFGRNGHLSNEQCFELLTNTQHEKLENIILAHMSHENNSNEILQEYIEQFQEKLPSLTSQFHFTQDKTPFIVQL